MLLLAIATSGPNAAGASSRDGYTINIDLPQAVLSDITITDTLPQGLIYRSGSLEVIGSANMPHETVSSPNDGSQPVTMIWSFGRLNKSDGQGLTLNFQPIVANVTSNRDGITLAPNRVSLQYRDSSGVLQTASGESSTAELVEPDLQIEMSASSVSGNVATYAASVTHSAKSHAGAFDSDLAIIMPSGVVYSPGSAKTLSGPTASVDDASPGELKWHLGEIDRSWNTAQKIVLIFNATTASAVNPDEITGILTWRSAPGGAPGSRSYVKTQILKVSGYTPSYAVGVKQSDSPDPVEAGQILRYTINYSNTGNDEVHGVAIKDSYDQNVTYLSSTPPTSPGKEGSWTIGDLKPGESGDILVEVRVNPSAADGTVLRNAVNMASMEASSDSAVETVVRGPPRNLTAAIAENKTLVGAGENNTSSTQISNSPDNSSENNTTIAVTKLSALPLLQANNESFTQVGNDSGNGNASSPKIGVVLSPETTISDAQLGGETGNNTSSTPVKQESPAQVGAQLPQEYTYKQTGTNPENDTASTAVKDAVLQQPEATDGAPKQTDIDTRSEDDTAVTATTLQFGDDIKVELVLQKSHLLSNYLVINKSDEIPNKLHSENSQPKSIADQTSEANQTNKSDDQILITMNKSVPDVPQPGAVSNQTTTGDNQTELSKDQTNDGPGEVKPELNISQSDTSSNQPSVQINQSTNAEDQTPAVSPAPPSVQPGAASNETNTGGSQSDKPDDQTSISEIMPALPAVQTGPASNQTEAAPAQQTRTEDQTPVTETKPIAQADQLNAIPAQSDNGAGSPAYDTSIDQNPAVESKPALPTASEPATAPTIPASPDSVAGAPDALTVPAPAIDIAPAVPASQPGPDLNLTNNQA